jgi:hypothetical protein
MRQVTHDLSMQFGISEIADLRRWDRLIIELEKNPHTLESLKKTDPFLDLISDYVIQDKLLLQLIKIHLDFHPF